MLTIEREEEDVLPVTTDVAPSHGGMTVSVSSLSHIKQSDVRSDGLAGLADLNEHVAVNL